MSEKSVFHQGSEGFSPGAPQKLDCFTLGGLARERRARPWLCLACRRCWIRHTEASASPAPTKYLRCQGHHFQPSTAPSSLSAHANLSHLHPSWSIVLCFTCTWEAAEGEGSPVCRLASEALGCNRGKAQALPHATRKSKGDHTQEEPHLCHLPGCISTLRPASWHSHGHWLPGANVSHIQAVP